MYSLQVVADTSWAYLWQQQRAGPAPTQLCATAEAPAFDGSDPEVSSGLSTETPWHTTSSLPPRITTVSALDGVLHFVNSVPINQSHMICDVTIILDSTTNPSCQIIRYLVVEVCIAFRVLSQKKKDFRKGKTRWIVCKFLVVFEAYCDSRRNLLRQREATYSK